MIQLTTNIDLDNMVILLGGFCKSFPKLQRR